MALARRVATSLPQQKVSPETRPDESAAAGTAGRAVRPSRLDRVPTQRGVLAAAPPQTPDVEAAPQQADRRRTRTALVAVSLTVTVALVAGTAVVAHQRSVRIAERTAADVRVASALAARLADATDTDAAQAGGEDAWTTALASARQDAAAAADAGTAQLTADVHADPALLAALRSAVDLASTTAADGTASLVELGLAASGVAGPAKAAQDAEAAWQVAEQARIAAEQKAAAEAAAAADAAAKAAAKPKTPKKTTTKSATSSGTSGAASPSGGAVRSIPAGGLVCQGAPVGAGASESSVSAIGAAINAYRQSNGLPALAVVRSGTLVAHAEDMAASGGIWHSGQDNIVGCTSGSVQSLLNAWAHSAAHNAQMLRTDVTTMKVGGASSGGWLYGAVKFSG